MFRSVFQLLNQFNSEMVLVETVLRSTYILMSTSTLQNEMSSTVQIGEFHLAELSFIFPIQSYLKLSNPISLIRLSYNLSNSILLISHIVEFHLKNVFGLSYQGDQVGTNFLHLGEFFTWYNPFITLG
jgi:hypothetical protein